MDIQAAARGARTQSAFRTGNERLFDLNQAFSTLVEMGDWLCECANVECAQRIELTMAEYGFVRDNPRRFAIAPGEEHLFAEIENCVEQNERFWVVEKVGKAGDLAALVDPRSDGPLAPKT